VAGKLLAPWLPPNHWPIWRFPQKVVPPNNPKNRPFKYWNQWFWGYPSLRNLRILTKWTPCKFSQTLHSAAWGTAALPERTPSFAFSVARPAVRPWRKRAGGHLLFISSLMVHEATSWCVDNCASISIIYINNLSIQCISHMYWFVCIYGPCTEHKKANGHGSNPLGQSLCEGQSTVWNY
jgi:hypothetical protein